MLPRMLEDRTGIASLAPRELDVLHHVGRGLSTREIATRFGTSVKTVEAQKERIKHKLGVATAAELATLASRAF